MNTATCGTHKKSGRRGDGKRQSGAGRARSDGILERKHGMAMVENLGVTGRSMCKATGVLLGGEAKVEARLDIGRSKAI
jgi:hypothetical protein